MNFTEELYEKISNLYVGTTIRGFSKLCGKCPSYYGSIKAQNLELSTSAITSIMGELEQRKIILTSVSSSDNIIIQLSDIQRFMADEIAIRHHRCSESQNIKIRHMLLEAVSNLANREFVSTPPAGPAFIG